MSGTSYPTHAPSSHHHYMSYRRKSARGDSDDEDGENEQVSVQHQTGRGPTIAEMEKRKKLEGSSLRVRRT